MGEITDRLWKKAGEMRLPLTGAFELLPLCNLNCKMCYVRKSRAEVDAAGGLLGKDEILSYAKEARDGGMLFPLLTGGEPFLREDLFEIFAGMKQLGLQISINSNGTLIDSEKAKWLGSHKPTRINITLYGASEESYQALCGDGSAYGRLRRAVEALKLHGVPVKFNASITPENIGELDKIIAYAKSVGSPIQVATYMFPPIRRDASMIGKNHRLSPEEAAYARVKADWLQADPDWFRTQAARFARFVPITDELLAKQKAQPPSQMRCRAGRCSFWLDWQGNLSNCGMYSGIHVPVREHGFAESWKIIVDETEKIRYSPVCTHCPNRNLCHACISMVYNECGDVNGRPEYLCRMNAKSAEYYREFAKLLPEAQASDNAEEQSGSQNCFIEKL